MNKENIKHILEIRFASLSPSKFILRDDSHKHVGHKGATGGGHYHIYLVSKDFEGVSRLNRHKMVYGLCHDLIPHRIHALSMALFTPHEDAKN